jgi:hypothetical protein
VQLLILQELCRLRRDDAEEGTGGEPSGKEAIARLHKMHDKVYREPRSIIEVYLLEVMENFGAEVGDNWQMYQWTQRISWGCMKWLQRSHLHVSHALTLSLKNEPEQSQAYLNQVLRGMHQCLLDNGSWANASLLLPKRDPVSRPEWGAPMQNSRQSLATGSHCAAFRKPRRATRATRRVSERERSARRTRTAKTAASER